MRKLLMTMVVILAVLVATVAQSSAQTINGCVNKKTGALRITTTACTKSETPLSWSQTGNLGVYDGTGLFLGYLVQREPDSSIYQVFHPDIEAFFTVVGGAFPPYLGTYVTNYFAFTSEDCSGQPYIKAQMGSQTLFTPFGVPDTFYLMDAEISVVRWSDLKSSYHYNFTTNKCITETNTESDMAAYAVKQILIPPLFNATIVHPIVVKPVQ